VTHPPPRDYQRKAPMPKLVYLWNSYTTKRHIKDPADETVTHNGDPISLCKFFFETRKEQERHFKKYYTGKVAKEHIAKMDKVPLCLKCQKAAIKLGLMPPAPEPPLSDAVHRFDTTAEANEALAKVMASASLATDVGEITVRIR
jgi:hypothetical protein